MLSGVYCLDLNHADINRPPELDIVFIHGIASSAEGAWTNANGDLWPLWLKPILPQGRVVLLNYPAPVFFSSKASSISIRERARNLADFLPTIGIGNRPTVFICHSLGGILLKEIIRNCVETGCDIKIAANTIGIVFLSTPHLGSNVASWTNLIGSALLSDLAKDSEYILALRDWFAQYVEQKQISISAYCETQKYNTVLVVTKESADPSCTRCQIIPVDNNHCDIAKPISPNADIFVRINRDIHQAKGQLNNMTNQLTTIDDYLSLPILTNKMYFSIVSLLNEQSFANSQKSVIISNPCSLPFPRCVIITQDPHILAIGTKLQKRFPDRFSIDNGILGELTADSERDPPSDSDESIDIEIEINLKPTLCWMIETTLFIVTARHVIDYSIDRTCKHTLRTYIDDYTAGESNVLETPKERHSLEAEPDLSRRKSVRTRPRWLTRWMRARDEADCLASLKSEIYERNKFKISIFNYTSKEFTQDASCKIFFTDYGSDVTILSIDISEPANTGVDKFCLDNTFFKRGNAPSFGTPSIEMTYFTPFEPDIELRLERTQETAFFPMYDKVIALRKLMVLSGCSARTGSSGSPIFDSNNEIVGMIVGRTNEDGDYKYLAIELAETISRFTELINQRANKTKKITKR